MVLFAGAAVLCLTVVRTGVEAGLPVFVALGVKDSLVGAASVDMTRSLFNAFDDASAFVALVTGLSDPQVVAAFALWSLHAVV